MPRRQDINKEIAHFQKTDWYRLEASEEVDAPSMQVFLKDMITKTGLSKHSKILEIACGGGQFGVMIVKETQADYVGLDLITELVRDAKTRAKDQHVAAKFTQGDAHHLPFKDNFFDLVLISYSLHHFPKDSMDQVTDEVYRVLKSGGAYYVLEPNGLNPLIFKWWLQNSPERVLPLGKKWRENWDLSVNETIIYPSQVRESLKRRFKHLRVYSLGFFPKRIGFFRKNKPFWENITHQIEKIPVLNKLGGSFVVIGTK